VNKRKQLQSQTTPTLKEYLDQYDSVTLIAIINAMEDSRAWDVFRAYIKLRQREFEVVALDLMNKDTMVQSAAYASGYAKALDDVSEDLIKQLKDFSLGVSPVVETPRPEESNL
jgi:hypothetical protein